MDKAFPPPKPYKTWQEYNLARFLQNLPNGYKLETNGEPNPNRESQQEYFGLPLDNNN